MSKAPIETPRWQRLEDVKRRVIPLAVWSLCAVIAVALMVRERTNFEYIGLAQASRYPISSATTGTIAAVAVDLFDDVSSGEIVVRLDDSQLLAEIETSQAEIQLLNAELQFEQAAMLSGATSADYTAELRRFQIDEENRRLRLLSLRVELETDMIEVERLALQVQRFAPLVQDGLLAEQEYDNARLRLNRVRRRIEENQNLRDQTEREYQVAQKRRIDYEAGLEQLSEGDMQLAPLKAEISVADARLREIEGLRTRLTLRSPINGQVSEILALPGQAVTPGDPILTVTDPVVDELIAYVYENDARRPQASNPVRVAKISSPNRVAESFVLSVSPGIQTLPQQLWRDPRMPSYGRAVRIANVPALDLTPGERVSVRFLD